jgi:hypothetical protein
MRHQRREQADKFDEKLQSDRTRKRVADRPKTKISGEIGQRTCKKAKSKSSEIGTRNEKIAIRQDKEKSRGSTDTEYRGEIGQRTCKKCKLGQETKNCKPTRQGKESRIDRYRISGEIGQRTCKKAKADRRNWDKNEKNCNKTRKRVADRPKTKISGEIGQGHLQSGEMSRGSTAKLVQNSKLKTVQKLLHFPTVLVEENDRPERTVVPHKHPTPFNPRNFPISSETRKHKKKQKNNRIFFTRLL